MADVKKKSGLDKRQRDIKVGAGLEEARYNVEFIDFLQRWGPTVMLVIAAAALGFWGLQKWRENRDAKQGVAFGDLDQAIQTAQGMDVNPDVLVRIAEDNASQGSVPLMARLKAAEQWRISAMKGYRSGATLDPKTGAVTNQDDVLTSDGKKEYLEKARAQYQAVVDQSAGNIAKATFTLAGYMGLAAVAETQSRVEDAKAAYKQAQELAEKALYPEYAALAKKRMENVEKYAQPITLLPESMVMSWERPAPVLPGNGLLPGSSLDTGKLNPGGATPSTGATDIFKLDTPSLTPGAAPVPAPAPSTDPKTPAPAAPEKKDEPKKP
jgi:hypothetical protein